MTQVWPLKQEDKSVGCFWKGFLESRELCGSSARTLSGLNSGVDCLVDDPETTTH